MQSPVLWGLPPQQTAVTSLSPHLCGYGSVVPKIRHQPPNPTCSSTPPLINLLQWLTDLTETFYLLDHGLLWKHITQTDSRDAQDQVWGKGEAPHMASPSKLLTLGSSAWELSESCCFGVVWRLHYIGMIDQIMGHWKLIQPSAPLPSRKVSGWVRMGRQDWNLQPVITVGFAGNQPPPLGGVQKSTH